MGAAGVIDGAYDADDLSILYQIDRQNRSFVSQFGHGVLSRPVFLHRQLVGRDHVDQGALYRRRKSLVFLTMR